MHYDMFDLQALGRARIVPLGTPISEDFRVFVLECTLRIGVASACDMMSIR